MIARRPSPHVETLRVVAAEHPQDRAKKHDDAAFALMPLCSPVDAKGQRRNDLFDLDIRLIDEDIGA